ncbi:hypothetical protein SASPL_147218 [Salvia splendens]|uniref:Uncharacterized protein n=1 Tax=Salvia splendens TaxID=180675 RepID=A0A8X8WES6_SALSN|nr:hypothetical protein SASPL_147218 [Salvia splendens]
MKDSMTCRRLFLLLVVCMASVERLKASNNANDQDCSWTAWALNKFSESSSPRLLIDIEIEKTVKRLHKDVRLTKQAEARLSGLGSPSTCPVHQTIQFEESEGSELTDEETNSRGNDESGVPLKGIMDHFTNPYDHGWETSKYASDIAGSTSDRVGNAEEWASPSGANEEQNNNAYESASEQAHRLMKTASDKAWSMAEDACNKVACDSALDSAGDAKHKTYGNAKSKLEDAYTSAKGSMSEQDKKRYEEAKEKDSQAAGDFGDKMRVVSTADM